MVNKNELGFYPKNFGKKREAVEEWGRPDYEAHFIEPRS